MTDRLADAQAALKAGRRAEAIQHLQAAVAEDPARAVEVYRTLVVQLYAAGRFAEGEAMAAQGAERFPRNYDLQNTRGVLLRRLGRPAEAAAVLETAVAVDPAAQAARQNLANVRLDLGDNGAAEAMLAGLVAQAPGNAEYLRQLARALRAQGKADAALARLREAVGANPGHVDSWLDLVGLLGAARSGAEAQAALDAAIAANPANAKLLEAKVLMLRRSGQPRKAQAFMEALLPDHPDAAWLHHQLGATVADWDRPRAHELLRRALELRPDNIVFAGTMIENLERNRDGDEGAHIEEAYQAALRLLPRKAEFNRATAKIIGEVFLRVCDFEALEALGDFRTLGRQWAGSGRHTALMKQLARVRTDEDRLELVEQHRIYGRMVEAEAARRPIRRPPPRRPGGRIRLGFMSSDLRQHPVGYFAQPLFDHVDHERFEVFVYSFFQGKEDAAQRQIAERVTAFRWWPDISVEDAAQRIAEDQLDMLIELGGSTLMNKLDVMAYRPAPLQASWLGYPHSAGLAAIDHFICDPYNRPTRPEYLIETPLVMPHTWLALGRTFFSDRNAIPPGLPSERKGYVTYGTANNPHKYSREVLRAWAKVVAATPRSRFAFIRPEAGAASFREHVRAQFALEGVGPERVEFHPVSGAHLPVYNELDVSLDPFPLTGGTTTTESLWMGVPLVTLKGGMVHERLSYSILSNAGLGDLCADTLDDYYRLALELAADTERRRALRAGLRDQLRSSPLGQTEAFARDFYEMVHKAVTERRPV